MTVAEASGDLRDLLDLEPIEVNLFRANFVFGDPYALYGGQVAAQALRAAALTIDDGRLPHSLHGYFLRPGNASSPTVYQVFRDRDGRTFSARRVVALQRGEVIFSMSASFQNAEGGFEDQEVAMPAVPAPEQCRPYPIPRLFSYEGRQVPQPYGEVDWPTRFWARCELAFDDPVLDACALTYLSDISTGLARFNTAEFASSSSLDHAVWFHRPARAADWLLNDMVPHSVSAGRGWYTGSMFDSSGRLVASFAQEALFRKRRNGPR
jgi:acyl-CoA thioesterase-2